jgi:cation diffusion facilitator CzcD-associated flavoprotein CzcO
MSEQSPAVVVIGSGFAGLGMAVALKRAGLHDFVILEKHAALGGTWRDNTYPGCACDVPSPLYSFSFELNPRWSRVFAPQAEIRAYLERTADRHGLRPHLRFGAEVEAMEYDEATRRWTVTLADGAVLTPRAVISGVGALHEPFVPDLPGIERFRGRAFHSAEWDHSYDLTGKRVGVVGTGASAVQFIPKIAERTAHLTVFQRTPPWIQPRPNARFSPRTQEVLANVPGAARALRAAFFWSLEARGLGFTVDPRLQAPLERLVRRQLERQVPDPELRARLTPDYAVGCKRVSLSNDYYPTLTRPDVTVETAAITGAREQALVTADGGAHALDCLIYATGFRVTEAQRERRVVGRDGVKLRERWATGAEAHHGTTLPGFPNLFLLLGPNTGLGHNSVVFMIEVQIQHVLSCLRLLRDAGAQALEPRPEAVRRYNDRLHRRLRRAVWSSGGCHSWYLDAGGVNRTLWPGSTLEFWAGSRRARASDYTFHP